MKRYLVVAALLILLPACTPATMQQDISTVPAASITRGTLPGFFVVYYGTGHAELHYRLGEPSRVVFVERSPGGFFDLLGDSLDGPIATGAHTLVVKRYAWVSAPAIARVTDVPCGYATSYGPAPCSMISGAGGGVAAGWPALTRHEVYAIILPRPVSSSVLEAAVDRLPDLSSEIVIDEFERLAGLPEGSTRWAVTRIALR